MTYKILLDQTDYGILKNEPFKIKILSDKYIIIEPVNSKEFNNKGHISVESNGILYIISRELLLNKYNK